jgi:hypothetical protein
MLENTFEKKFEWGLRQEYKLEFLNVLLDVVKLEESKIYKYIFSNGIFRYNYTFKMFELYINKEKQSGYITDTINVEFEFLKHVSLLRESNKLLFDNLFDEYNIYYNSDTKILVLSNRDYILFKDNIYKQKEKCIYYLYDPEIPFDPPYYF